MGLVAYSSSASESGSEVGDVPVKRRKPSSPPPPSSRAAEKLPPPAKRRLPSLPRTYGGISEDNPAVHGGKVRARPFVDGDYYAHVYVEPLKDAMEGMGQAVGAQLGVKVHSLLSPSEMSVEDAAEAGADDGRRTRASKEEGSAAGRPEGPDRTPKKDGPGTGSPSLHVSLSHPLPLRRPLSAAFAARVAHAVADVPAFALGLAWPPKVYNNAPSRGPRRAFLALRTAAGTRELHALLARIDALLRTEHLPTYHEDPEFHTSFAWWLDGDGRVAIERLDERKDEVLGALKSGWKVTHVCVKVAKTVTRVPLLAA